MKNCVPPFIPPDYLQAALRFSLIWMLVVTSLTSGFSQSAGNASKSVQGQVTDLKGQPLPGVNVVVKGSTQGTITGPEGRFSLQAPEAGEACWYFPSLVF